MYYLKKFFSIREIILMAFLLAAAISFLIIFENKFIMIMFVITVVVVLFALSLYIITAKSAYKIDFEKRGVTSQKLIFNEIGYKVESIDKYGKTLYEEKYLLADVDKVALLKDRVYFYPGVATSFYIYPEYFEEGNYEDFRLFLIDNIDKSKFKMKTRFRQFPYYGKKDKNIGGKNGQY